MPLAWGQPVPLDEAVGPKGAPLSPEQKEKLRERNRLIAEIEKLRKAGKLEAAARQIEKEIGLEKAIFGPVHAEVVTTLNWLASTQELRGDFAAARQARSEAMDMVKKLHGPGNWRVTDARLALGQVDLLARMTAAERVDLARARRLSSQGVALERKGKYAEAEKLLQKALAMRKELLGEFHPDYARSLGLLAALYQTLGKSARAEPLLRKALEIRKQVLGEEHPDIAASLGSLARLYRSRGNTLQAEPLCRRALAITKKTLGESSPEYAYNLRSLADLLAARGDNPGAEKLYRQVVAIRKKVVGEKHLDYAASLNSLAMFLQSRGDAARAEPLYRQALDITRDAVGEKHPDYATWLNNLALLYQSRGDAARAEPLLRQALEIIKAVHGEQHPEYASSLNNLAGLYQSRGDYSRAEPLYRQALEITRNTLGEKHRHYATRVNNLGLLYQYRGDYARAEPLLRQALEITRDTLGDNHPHYATGLTNLASLYQTRGDSALAEPLYKQALAITKKALGAKHPHYASILNDLARLYFARGDQARAEPYYRLALEVIQGHLRVLGAGLSERQLMSLSRQNRFFLDSYLSFCQGARLPAAKVYGPILAWKGQGFAQQWRVQLARKLDKENDSEASRLYGRLEEASRKLAGLALAAPTLEKTIPGKEPDEVQGQLGQLSAEVEMLERKLAERSRSFRAERDADRDPLGHLSAALPRDAVLVDFLEYWHGTPPAQGKGRFRYERRLLAFIVRPGGEVDWAALGPVRPLGEAVDEWRKSFGQGQSGQERGTRLRQLLWSPLQGKLQGARLVLVSPDGPLGRFPIAALPGRKAGSYLIEEQALAVVPVPRVLPELLAAASGNDSAPSLLAVGDVDYGAEPGQADQVATSRAPTRAGDLPAWKSLPATRGEVLSVRDSFEQRYAEGRVKLLRGPGATEAAFRQEAPKFRWLHVATHGFFAPPKLHSALASSRAGSEKGQVESLADKGVAGYHPGLLSGLVLAGANRPVATDHDDGILTALEVAALDLGKVELAVLSACETGLGESAGGEGLLGLQRAFQVAGARSVVASLWQVDDKATRALMERFYDNLWAKKLSRLEALREAQLWMLREGRKSLRGLDLETPEPTDSRLPPRYWAAFVLSGDWR
jgi:CHAT domain-containing protein/tetratricopeptide (TPR) repeat protein